VFITRNACLVKRETKERKQKSKNFVRIRGGRNCILNVGTGKGSQEVEERTFRKKKTRKETDCGATSANSLKETKSGAWEKGDRVKNKVQSNGGNTFRRQEAESKKKKP